MKKFAVLLAVLALLGAAAYGRGGSQGDSGKPVFMLCISHMTNAFTTTVANSMTDAAKAAGAELIINEGGNDISRQISQIESGVNQKVSAIIIEPVSVNGVIPAVEAAMKAGIPVIIFNQRISDPSKATTFVGVSNDTLGALEMRRAVQDLGGKGNVALLLGPMGSDGQLGRSKGYADVLAENPNVKVVFEETANWTTEEALRLVENWLQTGTTINAIVCQNDGMALGAVKAVEDKGLSGQIKVYGLDAVPDALRAVQEGRLEVSVSQATERQSRMAVDIAMKLYRGESVPMENLVEGEVIDKANVDQHL
ncbi:MAG: sugar ABC transporter substrate-binding protein [Spirochaetaceae bacterium]|jgi:ribose transport system substrate-binding protein/inositol transport system substrate-binding protein|nr:sugar ABC transporter substrate-binding protein [Spirochaetaceae bacterium]